MGFEKKLARLDAEHKGRMLPKAEAFCRRCGYSDDDVLVFVDLFAFVYDEYLRQEEEMTEGEDNPDRVDWVFDEGAAADEMLRRKPELARAVLAALVRASKSPKPPTGG